MVVPISPGVTVTLESEGAGFPAPQGGGTGAIVVTNMTWGPEKTVVDIDSEQKFLDTFGAPTDTNFKDWFAVSRFLKHSNRLKVVRDAGSSGLSKGKVEYASNVIFQTIYNGTHANDISIHVCPSNDKLFGDIDPIKGEDGTAVAKNSSGSDKWVTIKLSSPDIAKFAIGDYVHVEHASTKIANADGQNKYRVTGVTGGLLKLSDPHGDLIANLVTGTAKDSDDVTVYLAKWEFTAYTGQKPATNSYHVVVYDNKRKIVVEAYKDLSLTADAVNGFGENININTMFVAGNSQSKYFEISTPLSASDEFILGALPMRFGYSLNASTASADKDMYAKKSANLGGNGSASKSAVAYNKFDSHDIYVMFVGDDGQGNSGTSKTYLTEVINKATGTKDYIAVYSPPEKTVRDSVSKGNVSDIIAFKSNSSMYGMMISSGAEIFDSYNNKVRYINLDGEVAGIISFVDNDKGAWHSPAGHGTGSITGLRELILTPTDTQADQLFSAYINPIRTFEGEGTALWGDRSTISKSDPYDFIQTVLLFIKLKKASEKSARTYLFKLNNQQTRDRFRNALGKYLDSWLAEGAITEYKIKSTTTPADITAGAFKYNVQIKPVTSTRGISLTLTAVGQSVSFT